MVGKNNSYNLGKGNGGTISPMAKAINKTVENKKSVSAFLNDVENEQRRKDAKVVLAMMKKITKMKPVMWGPSIVGFGKYQYKRKDGSEHEFFLTGFSPRKANMTLYVVQGFDEYQEELKVLGKHKTSVSCLMINKLEDIDLKVLEKIIKKGFQKMKKNPKSC